eukprot:15482919-Alexandrium_andersonii.AAC.1
MQPEAARNCSKLPEAARSCLKAIESARSTQNCTVRLRAVSKLHSAALDVSCWAFGPLPA